MTDQRIEALAKAMAGITAGDPWPTNEMLGGSLAGTRDDEYRDGMLEQAEEAIAVADAADAEHGIHRVKVDEAAVDLVVATLRASRREWANDYDGPDNLRVFQARAVLTALADQPSDTNWGDQAGVVL